AWLALRLRRPVKWVAARGEDLLTTQQGRGGTIAAELAVSSAGVIQGLRARIVYPLGAGLALSASTQPWHAARTMPGAYVVPAFEGEVSGALPNTAPTGAYRGAGRPEGTFVIERLVDKAARALGLDQAEIRRRNFVPPHAFPYRTASGVTYDSGRYQDGLDKCLALAGYEDLRRTQAARRERDEVVGIGVVSYIEPSSAGWESGCVRVERTGAITVVTGSS